MICDCLGVQIRNYEAGKVIVSEGEVLRQFGVVLGGRAESQKFDASGKVFTVSVITEGGYIGILLAGTGGNEGYAASPVTVTATDRLTVMFVLSI